ncbi:MAG: exosortase/archaeosortase family protein [Terriglobales bacterium]
MNLTLSPSPAPDRAPQFAAPSPRSGSAPKRGSILTPGVALLGVLLVILYAPVLGGLVRQWWNNPNYSHGFLVLPLAFWLVWRSRDHWRRLPLAPRQSGLALMAGALLLLGIGSVGAVLFLSRISLLVMIAGLTVFLAGWPRLRAWSFPLGYALFMIPLPAIIYYQITFPLQVLASRLAAVCLDVLQVPALREGNLIILPHQTLAVAQACSGIRSLFALLALAVAYAYLAEPRLWRRITLALLMLPIAIVSNGARIVATGGLTYRFGGQWAEGALHASAGFLMFTVALALLLVTHQLLARIGRPDHGCGEVA